MKLLIAGSRSIEDFDLSGYVPPDTELIISGGARGIDHVAEQFAKKQGISSLVLRPQYQKYGKGAPLIRNEEMVALADAVLVVWDGVSRGTKHTLEYAKRAGKKVTVIMLSDEEK